MGQGNRGLVKSRDVAAFETNDQQFHQLAEIARVDLDQPSDALATLGADELSRAEFSAMRAGAYFLKLKQQAGHGGFLPALEAAGVSPDRAQRAMQIASYIAALPADQAKRLAALPRSKVLPLVNADPEVVGQLLNEGSLDGDEPLSVRELRDRLASTEKARIKAEQQNELLASEKQVLELEAAQRHTHLRVPPWCAGAREEAVYQGQAFSSALDLLDDALGRIKQADRGQTKREEFARHQVLAAGSIYHSLLGAYARAGQLLEGITAQYGKDVAAGFDPGFTLSPEEVERAELVRRRIYEDAKLAAANREIERENATPGKRGRKLAALTRAETPKARKPRHTVGRKPKAR